MLLFLDGISDPGNLGTIVRTAAAFRVGALILSADSVDIANPKAIRASAGQIFKIAAKTESDTEAFFGWLKSKDVETYGGDAAAGLDLEDLNPQGRICLILGSESGGMSERTRALCDRVFAIRTDPEVESLNLAAAAAISINRLARNLGLI
jgi:TrmH family RNA methyltransferase